MARRGRGLLPRGAPATLGPAPASADRVEDRAVILVPDRLEACHGSVSFMRAFSRISSTASCPRGRFAARLLRTERCRRVNAALVEMWDVPHFH